MSGKKAEDTAIIVVDVQGDFTQVKQGSLAVPGTDQAYVDAVSAKTRQLKEMGYPVLATQDWHPADHVSFFSNHPGRNPFDLLTLDHGDQVLWPPHCVQGTENAGILLDSRLFDRVVRKGMNPAYDSYSGFFDDGGHGTGLEEILREMGIQHLVVFGLTTDYCARATAVDARTLGFGVTLIEGLCRGVAEETTRAALEEMAAAGVVIR